MSDKKRKNHDLTADISFHIDLGEIEVEYPGEKKKLPFVKPKIKKQEGREDQEEKH